MKKKQHNKHIRNKSEFESFKNKIKSLENCHKIVKAIKDVFVEENEFNALIINLTKKKAFTEFSQQYLTKEFIEKIEIILLNKLKNGGSPDSDEPPDKCPICLDEYKLDKMVQFHCKHKVCQECFGRLISEKQKVSCPVCRTELKCGICKQTILTTDTTKQNLTNEEQCHEPSIHFRCGQCVSTIFNFPNQCSFCNNNEEEYDEEQYDEEEFLEQQQQQPFLTVIDRFQTNVFLQIENTVDRNLPPSITSNRILILYCLYQFLKIIFDSYNNTNITVNFNSIVFIISIARSLHVRISRERVQYGEYVRRYEFRQGQLPQSPHRGGKRRKQNKKTERKKRIRRTKRTRKNKNKKKK